MIGNHEGNPRIKAMKKSLLKKSLRFKVFCKIYCAKTRSQREDNLHEKLQRYNLCNDQEVFYVGIFLPKKPFIKQYFAFNFIADNYLDYNKSVAT